MVKSSRMAGTEATTRMKAQREQQLEMKPQRVQQLEMKSQREQQLEMQLKTAQGSVIFMQKEHKKILEGLHHEITSLRQKCSDLQFSLAMMTTTAKSEQELREQVARLQEQAKEKDAAIADLEEQKQRSGKIEEELREQLNWERLEFSNQLARKEEKIKQMKAQLSVQVDVSRLQAQVKRIYDDNSASAHYKVQHISRRARSPGMSSPPDNRSETSLEYDSSLHGDDHLEADSIMSTVSTSSNRSYRNGHPRDFQGDQSSHFQPGPAQYRRMPRIGNAPFQDVHKPAAGPEQQIRRCSSEDQQSRRSKLFRHHLRRSDHFSSNPVTLYSHANPPMSVEEGDRRSSFSRDSLLPDSYISIPDSLKGPPDSLITQHDSLPPDYKRTVATLPMIRTKPHFQNSSGFPLEDLAYTTEAINDMISDHDSAIESVDINTLAVEPLVGAANTKFTITE